MSASEIADRIAELCQTDSSVTHGTLCNRLGDSVLGDIGVFIDGNVAIFVGASEAFGDAVNVLRTENPARVVIRPIEWLCLLVDGGPLPKDMPMVRKPPAGGYKKPHFLPVCFDRASPKNAKWLTQNQRELANA